MEEKEKKTESDINIRKIKNEVVTANIVTF